MEEPQVRRTSRARKMNQKYASDDIDDDYRKLMGKNFKSEAKKDKGKSFNISIKGLCHSVSPVKNSESSTSDVSNTEVSPFSLNLPQNQETPKRTNVVSGSKLTPSNTATLKKIQVKKVYTVPNTSPLSPVLTNDSFTDLDSNVPEFKVASPANQKTENILLNSEVKTHSQKKTSKKSKTGTQSSDSIVKCTLQSLKVPLEKIDSPNLSYSGKNTDSIKKGSRTKSKAICDPDNSISSNFDSKQSSSVSSKLVSASNLVLEIPVKKGLSKNENKKQKQPDNKSKLKRDNLKINAIPPKIEDQKKKTLSDEKSKSARTNINITKQLKHKDANSVKKQEIKNLKEKKSKDTNIMKEKEIESKKQIKEKDITPKKKRPSESNATNLAKKLKSDLYVIETDSMSYVVETNSNASVAESSKKQNKAKKRPSSISEATACSPAKKFEIDKTAIKSPLKSPVKGSSSLIVEGYNKCSNVLLTESPSKNKSDKKSSKFEKDLSANKNIDNEKHRPKLSNQSSSRISKYDSFNDVSLDKIKKKETTGNKVDDKLIESLKKKTSSLVKTQDKLDEKYETESITVGTSHKNDSDIDNKDINIEGTNSDNNLKCSDSSQESFIKASNIKSISKLKLLNSSESDISQKENKFTTLQKEKNESDCLLKESDNSLMSKSIADKFSISLKNTAITLQQNSTTENVEIVTESFNSNTTQSVIDTLEHSKSIDITNTEDVENVKKGVNKDKLKDFNVKDIKVAIEIENSKKHQSLHDDTIKSTEPASSNAICQGNLDVKEKMIKEKEPKLVPDLAEKMENKNVSSITGKSKSLLFYLNKDKSKNLDNTNEEDPMLNIDSSKNKTENADSSEKKDEKHSSKFNKESEEKDADWSKTKKDNILNDKTMKSSEPLDDNSSVKSTSKELDQDNGKICNIKHKDSKEAEKSDKHKTEDANNKKSFYRNEKSSSSTFIPDKSEHNQKLSDSYSENKVENKSIEISSRKEEMHSMSHNDDIKISKTKDSTKSNEECSSKNISMIKEKDSNKENMTHKGNDEKDSTHSDKISESHISVSKSKDSSFTKYSNKDPSPSKYSNKDSSYSKYSSKDSSSSKYSSKYSSSSKYSNKDSSSSKYSNRDSSTSKYSNRDSSSSKYSNRDSSSSKYSNRDSSSSKYSNKDSSSSKYSNKDSSYSKYSNRDSSRRHSLSQHSSSEEINDRDHFRHSKEKHNKQSYSSYNKHSTNKLDKDFLKSEITIEKSQNNDELNLVTNKIIQDKEKLNKKSECDNHAEKDIKRDIDKNDTSIDLHKIELPCILKTDTNDKSQDKNIPIEINSNFEKVDKNTKQSEEHPEKSILAHKKYNKDGNTPKVKVTDLSIELKDEFDPDNFVASLDVKFNKNETTEKNWSATETEGKLSNEKSKSSSSNDNNFSEIIQYRDNKKSQIFPVDGNANQDSSVKSDSIKSDTSELNKNERNTSEISLPLTKTVDLSGIDLPPEPIKTENNSCTFNSDVTDNLYESIIKFENDQSEITDCKTDMDIEENVNTLSKEEIEQQNAEIVAQRLASYEHLVENLYLIERKKNQAKEIRRMVCDCSLSKEEIENNEKGCGDDCLNRLLMIECGNRCPLKEQCLNRQFQNKMNADVEVFNAENKGCGVRAIENIKPGKFIMEYIGEVFDTKMFKKRRKEYAKESSAHFYFMSLNNNTLIDATKKGNISRFVNHSCDPNAETQKWTVNGELRIGFFATKFIPAGEEINFDYRLERYGREPQKCFCGTVICRGWLGEAPDEKTREEKEEDRKREIREKLKRDEKRASLFDHIDLPDEIERLHERGLRNRQDTLDLSRLMVRAEDTSSRILLLSLLNNSEKACKRLFLDYHGLKLLWSWMIDIGSLSQDISLKHEILKTLENLPITNRTQLVDSKVLSVVEKWSKQEHASVSPESSESDSTPKEGKSSDDSVSARDSEISSTPDDSSLDSNASSNKKDDTSQTGFKFLSNLLKVASKNLKQSSNDLKEGTDAANESANDSKTTSDSVTNKSSKLVSEWSTLSEAFRIPKKERIEIMKEHEREVEKGYKEYITREKCSMVDISYYKNWKGDPKKKKKKDDQPRYERITSFDLSEEDKGLSKEERREKFAKKVAIEDEEARARQNEEIAMWNLHLDRCSMLGHNPALTPMFDWSGQFYWEPRVRNWQLFNGQVNLPCPALYAQLYAENESLPTPFLRCLMYTFNQPIGPIDPDISPMPSLQSNLQFDSPNLPNSHLLNESPQETPGLIQPSPVNLKLPPHWKIAVTEHRQVYFYHKICRVTVWSPPTEEMHEKLMEEYGLQTMDSDFEVESSSSSSESDFSDDDSDEAQTEDVQIVTSSDGAEEKMVKRGRRKVRSSKLVQERVISPIMYEDREAARQERKDAKEKAKLEARAERHEARAERHEGHKNVVLASESSDKQSSSSSNPSKKISMSKAKYSKLKAKSKARAATALADNSEKARKLKDSFRSRMANFIVSVLNPYRKTDCVRGRITSTEDFKYLARKLTHFVLVKELKQLPSVEDLDCSESVKHKTKEFVRKYMNKFEGDFKRDPNDTKEY